MRWEVAAASAASRSRQKVPFVAGQKAFVDVATKGMRPIDPADRLFGLWSAGTGLRVPEPVADESRRRFQFLELGLGRERLAPGPETDGTTLWLAFP